MLTAAYRDILLKFLRFGVVGATGTMVDFAITYLSKEVFNAHKYVANAFGFIISATLNYTLNRIWTFNSHNANVTHQFIVFFCVALIGLGLNTLILYFMHHNRKLNFYLSKVIATGVVLFWNFIANYLYTFK